MRGARHGEILVGVPPDNVQILRAAIEAFNRCALNFLARAPASSPGNVAAVRVDEPARVPRLRRVQHG